MSSPDNAPTTRRSRARIVTAGVVGGLLALTGGAYAFGYFSAGENLPSDTTVSGIAVGGVPAADAETLLREGLQATAEAPITLVSGSTRAVIEPADAGLTVDYAATIEQAGAGRSLAPAHIWRVLTGGGALDPVLVIDTDALTSAVGEAAATFAVAGKDATIKLNGTKIVTTESVQGVALDQEAAAEAVQGAWLTATTVEAPVVRTDPAITTAEVTTLADTTLKTALSGDITLTTAKGSLVIDPEMIADATTITTKDGNIAAVTSIGKLWDASQEQIDELDFREARNASWRLVGGVPRVVPSQDGEGVSEAEFFKKVKPLVGATTNRKATLTTVKAPATLTTAAASKLGVKEVTGEFTTYFPYAEYRNNNLSRAAASINNTFLEPGEIFSLNGTLGQRTAANGYMDGYVIVGNQLQKEVGGGVSQSATTTFNAAFFAGLKDVEHHPHSLYFDRYPAGREATVYYGALDLRFQNDTPYGVLMQAYVQKASPGGRGSITVRVWSTKVYDVRSSELAKSNFTTGQTVRNNSLKCHAQSASQGFDVNYSRLFYKAGSLVRTEPFFWRYKPTDQVICTNPDATDG